MTDEQGRAPGERAPSRDPDAHWAIPDADEDAREQRPDRAGVEPFVDMSNQNPEVAPRAAGPWPDSDAAPPAADRSTEDAADAPGLAPRGSTAAGHEAEAS